MDTGSSGCTEGGMIGQGCNAVWEPSEIMRKDRQERNQGDV